MNAGEPRSRAESALRGDFNHSFPNNYQREPLDNSSIRATEAESERLQQWINQHSYNGDDHSHLVARLYEASTGLLRSIVLALRKVATLHSPSVSFSDYVASEDNKALGSNRPLTEPSGSLASLTLSDQASINATDFDVLTKRQACHVSFRRAYHSLKLWGDGLGVSAGELDEVLLRSTQLRIEVLYSSSSIAQILAKCKQCHPIPHCCL